MRLSRRRLPSDVRAELRRGERPLARAATQDGDWVVATDTALYLPGLRLPWEQIEYATWKNGNLHVHAAQDHNVRLADPGSIPEVVRERVTATIVVNTRITLSVHGGAQVLARRDESGEVRWSCVLDQGLDPDDPALRERAERMIEDLRRQTGV